MTDISSLRKTIGDILDQQAEQFADREALIHVDWEVRYTFAQLRAECEHLARGLMALGIRKGDHVGIWATNYPEWVVAPFASLSWMRATGPSSMRYRLKTRKERRMPIHSRIRCRSS